jgi:hypothetical protein
MKPKRKIELGDIKDECKDRDGWCNRGDGNKCKYESVCPFHLGTRPLNIDLTDPPRFTEAQMAFLKGCYGIGIVAIMRSGDGAKMHLFTEFETVGVLKDAEIPIKTGETLDLAELFGKEGK